MHDRHFDRLNTGSATRGKHAKRPWGRQGGLDTPGASQAIESSKQHTTEIERGGDTVATVKKALVHVVRDRFSVEVNGGEDLEAKGNVVDHEYKIERDGDNVAEVSKRWFRVRDTYGIEIAPGQDDALILAVVVCIDQMSHE